MGPAIANLITFSIYNAVRYFFLLKKFNLQPFDKKTVYTIILAFVCFGFCYFLFDRMNGFGGIVLRSMVFLIMYIAASFMLKLSPDLIPVWHATLKKIGIKKGDQ